MPAGLIHAFLVEAVNQSMAAKEDNDGGWKSGLVALAVVAAASGGGWLLLKSGPKIQPAEDVRAPRIVKAAALTPESHRISVAAHGVVIAARQLVIEPEVSGPVVRLHKSLVPGGVVRAGEELLAIDTTLAELNLEEAKATVARSEAELKEAQRKRDEARQLADETLLSRTELAALEADVETEVADLQRLKAAQNRAEELLRRHVIKAPFNALILEEALEIGQRVDPGLAAATLAGTDEFWVRAALPIDRLRHIRLPRGNQPGAKATIELETGNGELERRPGRVVRLLGEMERTGRMARLLISVNDPLGLESPDNATPFLLGSYVRAEIDAGVLEKALAIDRASFRNGGRVWVADERDELQIRDAEVVWREDETLYIKAGLEPGERLIVSPLKVALPGMKLEVHEDAPPEKAPDSGG